MRLRPLLFMSAALLSGCADDAVPPASEIVSVGELLLVVDGEGELRSGKPTPLNVPGRNWSSRQVEWMLAEGSVVKKGDLLARFIAPDGKQQLDQALLDLQRSALARQSKQGELQTTQDRVSVDLAQVAVQLGIAQRYAGADFSALARNDVLDAIEDSRYLGEKQDTLEWRRGQSGTRGGAELAVLDAQRATFDLTAKDRKADLDALELRAPNDGVLLLTPSWSGDKPAVGASMYAGTEFGSLPDTAAMEVQIDLPQIEAQGVALGNGVELHPLGRPDQSFTSTLSWVASAAKTLGRESPVKYLSMRAPAPSGVVAEHGFVPGQRFSARVVLAREAEAISIANVAIEQRDGKHWVRVREGRDFVRREVELGVRGTARSRVLKGLRAGEEVLLAAARPALSGAAQSGSARDDATTGEAP
ncbi:MAG: hypothetical protein WA956_12785 [Stenotrophomonas sp.]